MRKELKRAIVFLVVAVLVMSVGLTEYVYAAAPPDVVGTEFHDAVNSLFELKIISGYGDGTYRPQNNISRAEIAKIVVGMAGYSSLAQNAGGESKFKDVAVTSWAAGYINVAAEKGFFKGNSEGNFMPDSSISYAEILTVLVRALGYGDEVDGVGNWPNNYIAKADELELIESSMWTNVMDKATRGNVAKLVWNTLSKEYAGSSITLLERVYPDYAAKNRKELSVEEIALNSDASVLIRAYNDDGVSYGSGIILDKDLIVTNYHVIEGSSRFGIVYNDTEDNVEYRTSTILYHDASRDLAIINSPIKVEKTVKIGDSDELKLGHNVIAIGSPLGLKNTVSEGIVSGFQTLEEQEFVQVTAPVSPGSSGGGLFNMYGELVGITTLKAVEGENINFAIPINELKEVLDRGSSYDDVALNSQLHKFMEYFTFAENDLYFNSFSWFDFDTEDMIVNFILYDETDGTERFKELYKNKEFRSAFTDQLYRVNRFLEQNFYNSHMVNIIVEDKMFAYTYKDGKVNIQKNTIDTSVTSAANSEFVKRMGELMELNDKPLFVIQEGDKWGYIDSKGNIVIPPEFIDAYDFYGGLAQVIGRSGDSLAYGYIDKTGKYVIEPSFSNSRYFSGGLAPVEFTDGYGYINENGIVVIEPKFDEAFDFFDGLAPVRNNDRLGYINMLGRYVVKPGDYSMVGIYSQGLINVRTGNGETSKWGYVDWKGDIVISPKYSDANFFSEGLASVKINNKYGFIDREGKLVIKPQFDYAVGFFEGLSVIREGDEETGKWGYIDKTGKIVIEPVFDEAYGFSEGLARVRDAETGKWGYINTDGEYAIKPLFDYALAFSNGLSNVRIGDKDTGYWCYINKNGEFVWKPSNADSIESTETTGTEEADASISE